MSADSATTSRAQSTICTECGALLGAVAEYHPYAFCVLVKAGLNPLTVVLDAAKALKRGDCVGAIEGGS